MTYKEVNIYLRCYTPHAQFRQVKMWGKLDVSENIGYRVCQFFKKNKG